MSDSPDPNPTNLDNYSIADLREFHIATKQALAGMKAYLAELDAELTKRLAPALAEALKAAGKEHGSLTREVEGVKVKGEIKQTVKWDNDALRAVAGRLTWDQVNFYFKIDFSVPEAIFKATPPGKLKDALVAARTTKTGDLSVSFAETKT